MATKIWVGTDTGNEGDINTAANWSPSGVPEAADTVIFQDSTQDADTGLATLAAIALAAVHIKKSYTGTIGDASDTFFQFLCSTLDVGAQDGPGTQSGSGKLLLDIGTTAAAVTVWDTGSTSDAGKPALRLKAANAATTVEIKKGLVGIASEPGETATVATINGGYVANPSSDVRAWIGSGVTLTTLSQDGGEIVLGCAATTVTVAAGVLTTRGSGAITTLNVYGGVAYPESSGEITTANCKGGTTDFTRDKTARTLTSLIPQKGALVKYISTVLTITNPITSVNKLTVTAG